MTCHCGKTALYQVGKKVFCRDQYEEAKAETVKEKQRQNSMIAVERFSERI